MKKIGITGQNGFIGNHLFNTLRLFPDLFMVIDFDKSFFSSDTLLDQFVSNCDVIVHLAGVNRNDNPQVIYDTNIDLAKKMISSLKRTGSRAKIFFSSSTQEGKDNLYGKSKKDARFLFQQWADETNNTFFGLIIPNVFGPFGKPFYNSVVATFCHLLTNNGTPKIDVDGEVKLIYVGELVSKIIELFDNKEIKAEVVVEHTSQIKVSELLLILNVFKFQYLLSGIIPELKNKFELNLFNTFRSYINVKDRFPFLYTQFTDPRGSFSEIVHLKSGGQVSFSTTIPGTTRGNHFHTRKIERFAVIKGKALIQLRKVGTEEIFDFYLDGNSPSYVDMPIWYTHNIKNIGNEDLYTIFWINEFYNSEDTDTFFETV